MDPSGHIVWQEVVGAFLVIGGIALIPIEGPFVAGAIVVVGVAVAIWGVIVDAKKMVGRALPIVNGYTQQINDAIKDIYQ